MVLCCFILKERDSFFHRYRKMKCQQSSPMGGRRLDSSVDSYRGGGTAAGGDVAGEGLCGQ